MRRKGDESEPAPKLKCFVWLHGISNHYILGDEYDVGARSSPKRKIKPF